MIFMRWNVFMLVPKLPSIQVINDVVRLWTVHIPWKLKHVLILDGCHSMCVCAPICPNNYLLAANNFFSIFIRIVYAVARQFDLERVFQRNLFLFFSFVDVSRRNKLSNFPSKFVSIHYKRFRTETDWNKTR